MRLQPRPAVAPFPRLQLRLYSLEPAERTAALYPQPWPRKPRSPVLEMPHSQGQRYAGQRDHTPLPGRGDDLASPKPAGSAWAGSCRCRTGNACRAWEPPPELWMFYGACDRSLLPGVCPLHMQMDWSDSGSLFVSTSREGDDRVPTGQAILTASVSHRLCLERGLPRAEQDEAKHRG